MSAGTKSAFLNLAAYQVGWFACVLGSAGGWAAMGASIAIVLTVAHVLAAERPVKEVSMVLAAGAIGLVADTLHARLGILDFPYHEPGDLAPLWIVALWLQFGTVFHFCLRWLSRRYALAFIVGLAGGPLAFVAGTRLGAASLGPPQGESLVLLGLIWALLLPLLVWLADRIGGSDRYRVFGSRGGRPEARSHVAGDGDTR